MTRMLFTTVFACIMAVTPAAFADNGVSALTGKSYVTGNTVTVGDLFTNTGNHAGHVLAPAPAVGDKLVLNKTDLMRVARAFELKWAPEENMAPIALERDALAIDHETIINALSSSPLQQEIDSQSEFRITYPTQAVIVDGRHDVDLSIERADYNADEETFHAELVISRDGKTVKTVSLQGMATPMVTIPTLRYPTSAQYTISESDILETKVPRKKLRGETIVSKEELIGMTTKRSVLAAQPLMTSDVTPPVMVRRNELVTVIYKNGPVHLSTKARALGNGVKGDTVTLINTTSKKSFDAVVTGLQTAIVHING